MILTINDVITTLPDDVKTVEHLVAWRKVPAATTAVAVNDSIVRRQNWESKFLNDNDRVVIISAAFGG